MVEYLNLFDIEQRPGSGLGLWTAVVERQLERVEEANYRHRLHLSPAEPSPKSTPRRRQTTERPEPTRYSEAIWLEPFPDVLLEGIPDQAPGPEARYETKEAIELGFIVGLQHLSPPQRAVLVLRDVPGYRAEEVAGMLDTTAQSVNGLLRRARAAFESRLPAAERERAPLPDSKRERDTVGRFADAIQTGDVDGVVVLLPRTRSETPARVAVNRESGGLASSHSRDDGGRSAPEPHAGGDDRGRNRAFLK
jgi:hypothetical protein